MRAGDIAAAIGLKDTRTGDTLCDDEQSDHPRGDEVPGRPSSTSRSSRRRRPTRTSWASRWQKLSEEDPTFRVHTDAETAQTIISGMGELHLEIIVDRMMREFKVDANIGRPQVAYRETIRKRVEKVEGKFIRQSGGKGQYGHVVINMEPVGAGHGLRVRGQDRRRRDSARVHRPGRAGHQGSAGERRAGRLSDGRREGRADLRLVPRRRLERNGVQDRGLDGVQGGGEARASGAARADDERRGRRARSVHGRRARRPVVAPRQDRRHDAAWRSAGDRRDGAAGRDVRVLDEAALDDAGARGVLDGVRALRGSTEEQGGRDHQQGRRRKPSGLQRLNHEESGQWQRQSSSGPSRT